MYQYLTMLSVLLCDLIRMFSQFISDKTVQTSTENIVLIPAIGSYSPSYSHGLYGTFI